MSSLLKLTLASGETQEIPFHPASTISVKTGDVERAYTDVTSVELVEVTPDTVAASADETGMLSSPAVALYHAKDLALADAAAHIERALLKFPDSAELAQVHVDISDAVRAGEETWSTDVELDPSPAGVAEEDIEPDTDTDQWLASPEAANEYVNALPTVEAAVEALDVALEKFPMSVELAETKKRADEYLLQKRVAAVDSHDKANELALELGVDGFEEKKPNLDEKKAALRAAAAKA